MTDPRLPIVDLIIPTCNEEENIPSLLAVLPWDAFRRIIVVDNGSADLTGTLARTDRTTVLREDRRGYGWACQAGVNWLAEQPSPPDLVAFLDADLADDPAQLPFLCDHLHQHQVDLVLGSRARRAQPGAMHLSSLIRNALACALIYSATGKRYADLGPMRVIRWPSLQSLNLRESSWGWAVEMQYQAAAKGLRILEVDVPCRPRLAGKSKVADSFASRYRAAKDIMAALGRLWLDHRARPWARQVRAQLFPPPGSSLSDISGNSPAPPQVLP